MIRVAFVSCLTTKADRSLLALDLCSLLWREPSEKARDGCGVPRVSPWCAYALRIRSPQAQGNTDP